MILAVDTTTNVLSVAVTEGRRVLSEYSIDHKRTHSQKLMPVIEAVLGNLGVDISEIDAFAAAAGPGSFTGIRIGLAAVRTLAQATGKKVAAVNTLLSLAYNAEFTKGRVLAVLDARGGNVYAAVYSFRGKAHKCVLEPMFISIEALNGYLSGLRGKTYAVGDTAGIEGITALGGTFDRPRASSAAFAAEAEGNFGDINSAAAVYINKPQAQRELEEREKNK